MKQRERVRATLLEKIAAQRTAEPYMSQVEHDEQAARYIEARSKAVIYLFDSHYFTAPEQSPGFALFKGRSLAECEAFCKSTRLAFSHASTCNPFVRCR